MDLFQIERYYFDDDEEESKCSAEKEKQRLQSLNERIRKRKVKNSNIARPREKEDRPILVSDVSEKNAQNEEREEPRAKKKKKKKRHEDDGEDNYDKNANDKESLSPATEKLSPKIKKKDKDYRPSKDSYEDNDNCQENLTSKTEKPSPNKKKKKGHKNIIEHNFGVNDNSTENETSKTEEISPKSKKKKKKKEKIDEGDSKDVFEEIDQNEESSMLVEKDSTPKKKKKKKKENHKEKNNLNSDFEDSMNNEIDNEGSKKVKSLDKSNKHKKLKTVENVAEDNDDDPSINGDCISYDDAKDNTINTVDEIEESKDSESYENGQSNIEENAGEINQDIQYFPVLGSDNRRKEKQIVKRTLPKWISEPRLMMADISQGKVPLDNVEGLSALMKSKLKENDIEYLFPVQAIVIPYLLSQQSKGTIFGKGGLIPSDICVSAPTGSGKTLAYVLPLIQILSQCFVRRLQAIVILPSKDLAVQIKAVISNYVIGTPVRVGLAAGMKSFQHEQEQLMKSGSNGFVNSVDILVCTPGRLVDHIDHTEGFTLEHLRFLIIDEADRLLGQSYHNWLEKIFKAAYRSRNDNSSPQNNIATFRSRTPFLTPSSLERVELPLQKLLFSATMTQNPEKLAPLQLFRPVLFTSSEKTDFNEAKVTKDHQKSEEDEFSNERFILPESLTEKMTICKQGEKPLAVIHLMKTLEYTRALCFTGSIETTHRLFLLVKACDIRVAEFSSTLNQSQRKGILRDFKTGKIDLLICSDAMSRGIDIDKVHHVISYDPPVNIKTYVHRVGRTARAGQQGMALTLLYPKEVFHFKKIIRNGKRTTLKRLNITQSDFEPLIGQYEEALVALKDTVENERSQGYKQKSKT